MPLNIQNLRNPSILCRLQLDFKILLISTRPTEQVKLQHRYQIQGFSQFDADSSKVTFWNRIFHYSSVLYVFAVRPLLWFHWSTAGVILSSCSAKSRAEQLLGHQGQHTHSYLILWGSRSPTLSQIRAKPARVRPSLLCRIWSGRDPSWSRIYCFSWARRRTGHLGEGVTQDTQTFRTHETVVNQSVWLKLKGISCWYHGYGSISSLAAESFCSISTKSETSRLTRSWNFIDK